MRILELLLAPIAGGAETLVSGLVPVFEAAGHEVDVATLDESPSIEQHRYFVEQFRRTPEVAVNRSWKILGQSQRLARLAGGVNLLRGRQYDVIHTHTLLPNLYGRSSAALVSRDSALISTFHSESAKREYRSIATRSWESLLLPRTAAVTCVSENAMTEFQTLFPRHQSRFLTIPNGIPRQMISKDDYSSRPARFVTVSRLTQGKGITTLISGFSEYCRNRNPEASLTIVGPFATHDFERECHASVQALGMQDRIEFSGLRNDIAAILPTMDCFIAPSLGEAQAIAPMEAIAAGLPVVMSEIRAHSHIAASLPGKSCLTFVSGDSSALGVALAEIGHGWQQACEAAVLNAKFSQQRWSLGQCASRYLHVFNASTSKSVAP